MAILALRRRFRIKVSKPFGIDLISDNQIDIELE